MESPVMDAKFIPNDTYRFMRWIAESSDKENSEMGHRCPNDLKDTSK
jgi:hypothetical protein